MALPNGRAALAAGVLAIALLVAWLIPALAVAIVWPPLLFVPGWAIVSWAAPRVDLPGRLGLAVVLSVAVSAHLVFWLSLAVGDYGRPIVFVVAWVLALPVAFAAGLGRAKPITLSRALPALVVAALGAALVGATLATGMWQLGPDGIYSGGSNWSDLGVHLSIAQSLNAGGNFPPEVPYFAGVPLVYHWFADFHAAILAEAANLFAVPAMIVQSVALTAALALIVFSLARRLLRARDARRAATIAAAIAVFGGGLGWIRFIGDVTAGAGSPLELIARNSYDNIWFDAAGNVSWPYFRIPSVMGTGLLAHRATTAGLPMLAGSMLLLVAGLPSARAVAAGWRDNPAAICLAGVLGALLAPFHFFFFPVVPLLALAWVATAGRLTDRNAPRNAALFLLPYVVAIPWVLAPALQASRAESFGPVWGWASVPSEGGPAGAVFFYVTNLGVPFALTLVALVLRGTPKRLFLAAWVALLFGIPNIVQLSVIDFDMNKYFQAMWIGVAVLAAWLMRRWPVPALAVVFLLTVPSPLLVAGWTATSRYQVISIQDLAAADWAASATPPGSVFLTNGHVNSFTDAAGRLRLTTFGPYVANLGYAPDERIARVQEVYCGGDPSAALELARSLGADYVVDGARPQPCETPTDFGLAAFVLVYQNQALRIWEVTG